MEFNGHASVIQETKFAEIALKDDGEKGNSRQWHCHTLDTTEIELLLDP